MTIRSLDFKISSEKFFNGLWLCWRLHNDKVFWHNDRFWVKDRFLVYGNYWGLQAEIKKAERSFIIKQVKIWFFLFSYYFFNKKILWKIQMIFLTKNTWWKLVIKYEILVSRMRVFVSHESSALDRTGNFEHLISIPLNQYQS